MAPTPDLFSHLLPIRNRGVFSDHWLDRRLELEPEWTERETDAADTLTALGKLWAKEGGRLDKYPNEAGLEYAFIQPVLEALGWKLRYQVALKGREPDYALFLNDDDFDAAMTAGARPEAVWDHAAVVADAKRWDLPLDKKVGTGARKEYPPEQIEWYLDRSRKPFAILTNGRLWRLIPREIGAHQRRFQTYYEVNLASILTDHAAGGEEGLDAFLDFRRFFLFFGPAGHTAAGDRTPLVIRAVEGSSEYRLSVSETLKGQAFEALRVCIEGFLAHQPNQLDPDIHLESCRTNGFTLLCRLLFILFAEDRRLLPYRVNRTYTSNRSLGQLRDDIAERLDNSARGLGVKDFSRTETGLWDHLTQLFDLIDRGHGTYGVTGRPHTRMRHPVFVRRTRRLCRSTHARTRLLTCQAALSHTRTNTFFPSPASCSHTHPRNSSVVALTGRPSQNRSIIPPVSARRTP
jgi:hypothetical protein